MASRRGKGEGSIYQRESDGLWVGSVNLGYVNGKRKRKPIYGKTRREVAEKLKGTLSDQQQGLPIATGRQTVAQFLDRWLEDVVKHTRKATTYVTYRGQIKNHLVDPPSTEKYEGHAMNVEQAQAFLRAVSGHRLEALWTVAIAIGLRRGEALALRWADVDLDGPEPSLTVRGGLYRIGGKLQILQPKTNTSTRNIMLPAIAVNTLRAHRVRQLEERLLAGSRWQDNGLVFATSIGTPLEPRNVTRLFVATLENAGLPRMRLHDARHTAATLMLVQGIPVKVVSGILGHARASITQDIYQHVIRSQQRDAAQKMDGLLG